MNCHSSVTRTSSYIGVTDNSALDFENLLKFMYSLRYQVDLYLSRKFKLNDCYSNFYFKKIYNQSYNHIIKMFHNQEYSILMLTDLFVNIFLLIKKW